MPVLHKRAAALLCACLLAVGLAACGGTAASGFKGEEHEVAQVVANLQTEATAGEQKKICANVLASALVKQLSSVSGGCAQAIKSQLAEVDSLVVNIKSVHVNPAPHENTASALVTSIYSGKTAESTLQLVKESGKWRISGTS